VIKMETVEETINISFAKPIEFRFSPSVMDVTETVEGERLWFEGEAEMGEKHYSHVVFYAPIELELLMRKMEVELHHWYNIYYLGRKKHNNGIIEEYKVRRLD